MTQPQDHGASGRDPDDNALHGFVPDTGEPTDPRDREVALLRLRDASDEELAMFEGRLRDDALKAGATESEMREAQRHHPGHGG